MLWVRLIEVGCHWFVRFLGLDIRAVAIETDVHSIDRLADILHSTFSAMNLITMLLVLQVKLARLVRSSCAMTFETVPVYHVRARFAVPPPTGGIAHVGGWGWGVQLGSG